MKLGPFELTLRLVDKAAVQQTLPAPAGIRVPPGHDGWFNIREPFAGAWQRGISAPDPTAELLQFGAIYAATGMISGDVAKMRPVLQARGFDGIWRETDVGPAAQLLRRPNRYMTWSQLLEGWVNSRLLHGNSFLFKERGPDRSIEALHLLDPSMVGVVVTDDGGVYYQLKRDVLAGLTEPITVPASEIAHDRQFAVFHPLLGISTIRAAAASGTYGRRIQEQSQAFFANMSRPSGQLTSEHEISDETAERLKRDFEANFAGTRLGRMLVAGSGLRYEAFSVPAADAQLVEQLKWTGEDIARVYRIPAYKLGVGPLPSFNNIAQLQQDYFTQALQGPIQSIELLLAEALELPVSQRVELDTSALLRMDPLSRAETAAKLVGAGILAPNEARASENLPPVRGGEVPYLQQQNWQLSQLAGRTPPADAPAKGLGEGVGVGPSSSSALGQ